MYREIIQETKGELEEMKQFTNRMCESRGWHTPEKGKDYHGNNLAMGHVRAWSKAAEDAELAGYYQQVQDALATKGRTKGTSGADGGEITVWHILCGLGDYRNCIV